MGNQENNSGAANTKKKPFRRFIKKSNKGKNNNSNKSKSNGKTQSTVREYKFHLHDSDARKKSESYEKIKEAIVLKIQKTFEKSNDVATSIETKTKHSFTKPTMQRSSHGTPATAEWENEAFKMQGKQRMRGYQHPYHLVGFL